VTDKRRLAVVVVFAAVMAWVESATVVYMRTLIGRLQPYQPNPLLLSTGTPLAGTEAVRELATLLTLLAVGWLAGSSRRSRLAYALKAFGVWDIPLYVFTESAVHSLLAGYGRKALGGLLPTRFNWPLFAGRISARGQKQNRPPELSFRAALLLRGEESPGWAAATTVRFLAANAAARNDGSGAAETCPWVEMRRCSLPPWRCCLFRC
jgi:hypothetical protein